MSRHARWVTTSAAASSWSGGLLNLSEQRSSGQLASRPSRATGTTAAAASPSCGADINAQSEYTRIEGNTVAGQPRRLELRERGRRPLTSRATAGPGTASSTRSPGNSVGAVGEGGGIYVGAATPRRSSWRRPRCRGQLGWSRRAVRRSLPATLRTTWSVELDRVQRWRRGHRRLRLVRCPLQRRMHDGRRPFHWRDERGEHLRGPEARGRRRTSTRRRRARRSTRAATSSTSDGRR